PGFMPALVRARIPYLPVNADDIDRGAAGLAALILPNLGALSNAQAASIRRFVRGGGSLVATGDTGLYDEWGDPRRDFALADLFRCHLASVPRLRATPTARDSEHTYLRLSPDLPRHPVLSGFDETDILAYGGTLSALDVETGA